MDITYLVALLFLVTLSAVLVFAVVSKARTEKRMKDDDARKSTLAKDAPDK
ncbi:MULTISPECIES: hypothetical protein [Roseobacter]|uniref:hypothetical protein n=1 Tax=Roseobacter TaxID=2433 RepID=UPI000160C3A1|nr:MULTISPECIES: hypothetical protein [Roseobacter]GIT87439.1 hypothetical protein ROBYS_24550 [Roseobacter sp. OBYS 0001]